jgi:uncharacterized membrane protein YjjP (DUF1212 family)
MEFVRSPWFLLAAVLILGGAFLALLPGWWQVGWAAVVLGACALGYARYRRGF